MDISYQVILDDPEIAGSFVWFHSAYTDQVRETVSVRPQYILDSYQTDRLTTEYAGFTFTNNTLVQTTFDLIANGLKLYTSGGTLVNNIVVNPSTVVDISYQVLLDDPEIAGSFVWFHSAYTDQVRETVSVRPQYILQSLQSTMLTTETAFFTFTNNTLVPTTFDSVSYTHLTLPTICSV